MYDARKRIPSGDGNVSFGVATLVVVSAAFFGVWKGPDLFGGGTSGVPHASAASAPEAAPPSTALAELLPSPDEQRYLAALGRLDPASVDRLEAKLAAGGLDREAQIEAIHTAAVPALLTNLETLAHISVADLDAMLDSAIVALRRASGSRTPLCQGRTYAALQGKSEAEIEAWFRRQGMSNERFYGWAMRFNADFLEMVERAKANPTRHGKLTRQDEMALQGVMMSLMTDPSIMQAMASGGDEAEAIRRLDVCSVAITALSAVQTLPDETKGRAWAAMFTHPQFKRALNSREFKDAMAELEL